jgi:hypothetical protein
MDKAILKSYIDAGLVILPVDKAKRPLIAGWQNLTKEDCQKPDFLKNFDGENIGVGLQCGGEKQIVCVDLDTKYDLTGTFFNELCTIIKKENDTLLKRLIVQRTPSGGYHFIFSCPNTEGNQKLARRPSTREELISTNAQCYVLAETRQNGGQVLIIPSPNYKLLQGDFLNIPSISPEEKDLIFTVCRSFNTYNPQHLSSVKHQKISVGGTIFEQFNKDIQEGINLLEAAGWKEVGQKGKDILFLRPGHTSAAHSAYYHTDSGIFVAFTSSSAFEPEKGYNNSAILHTIEGHRDWKQTAERLKEMGYSEDSQAPAIARPYEEKAEIKDENIILENIENVDNYADYIENARLGKIEMGKTTGSSFLDEYFLFKKSELVVINGFGNLGKSFLVWYLTAVSSVRHNWKWLIFTSENPTGQTITKIIEFMSGKPIKTLSKEEAYFYRERVKEFYMFVRIDKTYTVADLLKIGDEVLKVRPISGFLIDPYNSLSTKGKDPYVYHYECISAMRAFSNRTGCGIWLIAHPQTGAARGLRRADGLVDAPQAHDTENGSMYMNRADCFLTVHRHIKDPVLKKQTLIYVRKVKNTDTGGQVSEDDSPVVLYLKNGCRFVDDSSTCLMTGMKVDENGKDILGQAEYPLNVPTVSPLTPNTNFDNPFIIDDSPPF